MIIFQQFVDIFALDLLILCLQTKLSLIILACFCLTILKKNDEISTYYNFKFKRSDTNRSKEINKIKNYFTKEIYEREIMSKKTCIAIFVYFDKTLIVLSAASGGVSIGIARASFSLMFSLNTGIIKKLLKITNIKKKKHNKIVMLARNKLNSVETLISQTLIDLEISPEEGKTIINEEENPRRLKDNIRIIEASDELNEKENKKMNSLKLLEKIIKMHDETIFLTYIRMDFITKETYKK